MAKFSLSLGLLTASFLIGCADVQQSPLAFPSPNLEAPVLVGPAKPGNVAEKPKPISSVVEKAPSEKTTQAVKTNPTVPAAWIPRVEANAWKWIVIHHSATVSGGAASVDRRMGKRLDELGYHFVIGNGTGSGDGEIEVGSRWPIQKWGAHAKTPDNQYNDFGIGICLVGNFETGQPTARQLESLTKLTSYLMETHHISSDCVIGHGQVKGTDCPGKFMPMAWVRQESTHKLAEWRTTPSVMNPPIAKANPR